jgi:hypothetical protein
MDWGVVSISEVEGMSERRKKAIQSILFRVGALALAFICAAVTPIHPAAAQSSVRIPDAPELVAKVGERLASYPKLESWQARAHSTKSRMSSDWTPKSTTTSEKIVKLDGGRWSEEVLSASTTEGGRARDITKKLQAEARERAEKRRRSTGEEERSRGRRSPDVIRDEALPFSPEKRSAYEFSVKGPADLDGTPVILLQSRSRVRSGDRLEGLYYVHPGTFDVLRAELTMAKRPIPVKRMEMEIDFLVLPEGYQVMKKAVVRVVLGLIIKNIRVEDVETYSDHVVR